MPTKRVAAESDEEEQEAKKRDDGELKTDSEKNTYLDLGANKRITISMFKGRAQMNIREYYIDKSSNELRPGKKGITLNSTQWSTLVAAIDPLTKQLKDAEAGGEESSKPKKKEFKKADKKPPKKKKKANEEEAEDTDDDD